MNTFRVCGLPSSASLIRKRGYPLQCIHADLESTMSRFGMLWTVSKQTTLLLTYSCATLANKPLHTLHGSCVVLRKPILPKVAHCNCGHAPQNSRRSRHITHLQLLASLRDSVAYTSHIQTDAASQAACSSGYPRKPTRCFVPTQRQRTSPSSSRAASDACARLA